MGRSVSNRGVAKQFGSKPDGIGICRGRHHHYENALAVILGANLGTTITGWIVALAGFNLNIETIALPVAGIAGLGFAIFNKQTKWFNWSRFLFGFSFCLSGWDI